LQADATVALLRGMPNRQPGTDSMAETTPPSENTPKPKPEALPPGVSSHTFLNGNASIRSMATGGVTHTSDTPLTLRMIDPAILSNSDQPQPPRRSPSFDPGGPAEPPFPPPTNNEQILTSVRIDASVGTAAGAGVANGVGAGIAEGVGNTARRIDAAEGAFRIDGESPDIAQFVGHVTARRTVIIRTVLSNRVAVQLTALSFLAAVDLEIENARAGGSNSEITELDDWKRRLEEFLAANEKGEETAIADATLSIADGLRHYWTKKHETICDVGLFGAGLAFCAVAGALGVSETNILAVTALAGGNRVVDVVKAAADLAWGKGDKS
jgi:hypothetical protein